MSLLDLLSLFIVASAVHPATGAELKHFYPFGYDAGDTMLPPDDSSMSDMIPLSRPFPYYGIPREAMWVNTDGVLSFTWGIWMLFGKIPADSECVIAPFAVDLDTTRNDGRVYYRQTTDSAILQRASTDVQHNYEGASEFSAEWVLIATFDRVTYYSGDPTTPVATFQAVLISGGDESYVIFNYGDVQFAKEPYDPGYAQMGFDKGDRKNYYVLDSSYTELAGGVALTTNVGVLGRWLFRVDGDTIVPGGIFPNGVYNCGANSPCNAANRLLGKYYFPYIDMSRYVQCGILDSLCWVRPCPTGSIFRVTWSTCVNP